MSQIQPTTEAANIPEDLQESYKIALSGNGTGFWADSFAVRLIKRIGKAEAECKTLRELLTGADLESTAAKIFSVSEGKMPTHKVWQLAKALIASRTEEKHGALWIPPVHDCEWIRRWKEERNKKDYWLEFNACVVQCGDLEAECKTLREQVGRLSKYVCTNGVNKVCNCCGRFPHKKDCEIAFIASRKEADNLGATNEEVIMSLREDLSAAVEEVHRLEGVLADARKVATWVPIDAAMIFTKRHILAYPQDGFSSDDTYVMAYSGGYKTGADALGDAWAFTKVITAPPKEKEK